MLIYYLKHDLGQGDGVVGLVLAVAALGTVGGALVVAPLRRRLGFGTCWIGAVLLCGLAVGGLGATGSVPPAAVLAALYLGMHQRGRDLLHVAAPAGHPGSSARPGDGRLLDHPLLAGAGRAPPS